MKVIQLVWLQTFPVTHEVDQARTPGHEFHVLGVIERKAILRMLQHHVGFCTNSERAESLPEQPDELTTLLARFEQRPLKVDSESDQDAIVRSAVYSAEPAFAVARTGTLLPAQCHCHCPLLEDSWRALPGTESLAGSRAGVWRAPGGRHSWTCGPSCSGRRC